MRVMGMAEFWARLAVGAVLVLLGFLLQAAWVSGVMITVGFVVIVWTAVVAVRQVRRAEEIQRARRQ